MGIFLYDLINDFCCVHYIVVLYMYFVLSINNY